MTDQERDNFILKWHQLLGAHFQNKEFPAITLETCESKISITEVIPTDSTAINF